MSGKRARGRVFRRLADLLIGDEPAAIEVLLGTAGWRAAIAPIAGAWMVLGGLGGVVAAALVWDRVPGFHPLPVLLVCAAVSIGGLAVLPFARTWPRYWFYIPAFAAPGLGLLVIGSSGAGFAETAVFVPAFLVAAFGFATRRAALLLGVMTLSGYAILLAVVDGYAVPAARFAMVAAFTATSGTLLHWAVSRLQEIAESERRAAAEIDRLAGELSVANARLHRYVPPQVAAVVGADEQGLLQPHRADISVLFVDLRGFTAFSVAADPDVVVEVLADYYAVIGQLVEARGATLARFAGDGIMAYFGDPVPCDDPGGAAVDLALEFRGPMDRLRSAWQAHGHGLGYGVGIGTGPATLGSVGFEERRDYTALGPVVNLAARLCAEAADGDILIDGTTFAAVRHRTQTERRTLRLKGLPDPVVAYSVSAATGGH